ncbi:MAG: peptidylprolyl isomerase [Armatimonadota bacterium]|nr:peptidylprolyl isomerase [Armatimonadota bacterium]MCX7777590.1 peptidylprolyl isomerase [Armatimonadota bacterium]MDW8025599.1 peptidylprolyl isomerase [Armatimonadota bacterium]
MSLRKLRRFIRIKVIRTTLWLSIFFIFLIGTFVSFGTIRRAPLRPTPPSIVVKVNGWKIMRNDFDERLRNELAGGSHDVRTWVSMKYSVLDRVIDEILLRQAARKHRIRVSRSDIHKRIDEIIEERIAAQRREFRTLKEFMDWVRDNFGSLGAYKAKLRSELLDHRPVIELQILHDKLREFAERKVKVTNEDVRDEYCRVRLRHIQVSYDRFMKEKTVPSPEEREKAMKLAEERAAQLLERLRKGEKFEELAKRESDDTATANKGGELGWLDLRQVGAMYGEEVAKAAKGTSIGKPTTPIKGVTGYHILKVEERKFEFPPEYYKARYRCLSCRHQWEVKDVRKGKASDCPKCHGKKIKVVWEGRKEVFNDVRRKMAERAWLDFQNRLRFEAKIEMIDPELAAYRAEMYGDEGEALKLYKRALRYAETREEPLVFPAAILFRVGSIYERQNKKDLALQAYRRALSHEEDPALRIRIARLLKERGKKKEALRELDKASELISDPWDRLELAKLYEELGNKSEAAKQRKLYEIELKERFGSNSERF